MRRIEMSAGTHILNALRTALKEAEASGETIVFDFNGITHTVAPDDTFEHAHERAEQSAGQKFPLDTDPIPLHARDALHAWDRDESVHVVEMGGLGPGYEQAIQVLVFEIVRDYLDKPLPEEGTPTCEFGEDAVKRCDKLAGGFSGAQVGAAKSVAYRYLRDGWRKTVRLVDDDRRIIVSRHWPQAPTPTGPKQ